MERTVWLAWFIKGEHNIYGTAEKAYNAVRDYIKANYDEDDDVNGMLKELEKDYTNYPDCFGVFDVAGADAYIVE